MGKVVVEDDAAVTGHGIEQSANAGDAGVCTVDEADAEHQAEDGGGGSAFCCLKDELDDGHAGGSGQDSIGVDETEEHDEDEGKAPGNSCVSRSHWRKHMLKILT